ncbi:TIGR00288 family protein [Abditibacterium utsteinense]|uniref:TIGR00288 family protein n=1 Tax=Abditibacterium utsteinense TaxID=1960156 RepID=A0A2S8SSF1_9BACT|nr:NYN domain-containing protein [Abditibacterium utsteinense]PQV63717.1 TIGR00288 family protein [Abditibacterium utsteinense]
MEPLNGLSHSKIALLIDFDNVLLGIDDPGFDVELVVNALRERGTIVMGRCYGDWYRHNRHRRKLMEQGLELVETPAFGPVIKNSADIRIALDGLEIGMTQHHIDTFCLVSGDSDFLPLIKKLQYLGKQVLVICGNRFTSDMLRRNCNEFISYENLLAQSVGATEDATTLEGAFALLHRAMEALRERGAEIRSSTVKQMMLQLNPTFSERNFGCPQFRGFLDKAVAQGLIKLGGRDRISGEFSVLLPEEDDDKIPAENRLEIKNPEVKPEIKNPVVGELNGREAKPAREPRAPRAPRESRLKNAREISDAPTIAPSGSDLFAPATPSETDDHSTTSSSLISRGLRRGKLRFSGKSGKPERIDAPFEEIFGVEPETTSAAALETETEFVPESATLLQNASQNDAQPIEIAPQIEASNDLNQLAEQVAQVAAQISVGTQDAPEIPVAPAMEAALEAQAESDKKPARRRRSRSKSAGGEKGVMQTVPVTKEVAAQNESDANAIGLTFPGKAFEIETSAPPEAVEELASQPVISTPVEDETATEATSEVPATEAATSETEAPKKPARRRRSPRKKADAAPENPPAE